MKLLKTFALLAVAITIISASSTAASASAPPNQALVSASKDRPISVASLATDENVLEFLSTGRGPLAEELPELSSYLPQRTERLTSAERVKMLDEYQNIDAKFHERVTIPFASGDPYRTLAALDALTSDTQELARTHGVGPDANVGKCATLVTVVLWLAVALAVVLWVPAYSAPDNGSIITTREFAAQLATSMQGTR